MNVKEISKQLRQLFCVHAYSVLKHRVSGWQVEFFGFKEFIVEDKLCSKCGKEKHKVVQKIK